MIRTRLLLFMLLVAFAGVSAPKGFSTSVQKNKGGGEEGGGKKQSPERAITQIIRGMQMDMETSSSRGFLSAIDDAKFDDYPRFESMIEQLMRENSLRVYFRQGSTSVQEGSAQVMIDAEMEMTRKDAANQVQQRRQQLTVDFENTSRGWKIINITPREFFQPQ
jgi:hypothetical protein